MKNMNAEEKEFTERVERAERDAKERTTPKEIYRGGRHAIYCDGENHIGVTDKGITWHDGKCFCKEEKFFKHFFSKEQE